MAIGTGVTEIADSEEEPLTSSPAAVSDEAVDKLSVTADQDTQAWACPHQELADHIANQASGCTDVLLADHKKFATNVKIARPDQSDAHSANERGTNNTACALRTASEADLASSLLDAETSIELERTSQLDERIFAQIKQQTNPGESPKNYAHFQLSEDVFIAPDRSCILQNSLSKDQPEIEAVNRQDAITQPSWCDHVQLASRKHDPIRHKTARAVTEDQGNSKVEDVTTRSSHDINHGAAKPSQETTPTDHQGGSGAPDQTGQNMFSILDPMHLDAPPEALNVTPPGFDLGQHDIAVGWHTNQDTSLRTSGMNDLSVNQPARPSAAPTSGIGGLTPLKYHEANSEATSALFPIAQSHPIHGHGPSRDLDERENETQETASNKLTLRELPHAQGSLTPINKQDQERLQPLTDSNQAATTTPPANPSQSLKNSLHTSCEHNSVVQGENNSVSKVFPTQEGGQSAASEISQPASPRPAAKLSPQEITLAELRAQKTALLGSLRVQPAIQVLMEENQASDIDISDDDGEPTEAEIMAAANKIVREHIKLLHEYNELKDIGQGLMGLIADQRGTRIVEVQDEFGIDAND